MKKAILLFTLLFAMFAVSAFGQSDPTKETLQIDKILEADANHNLDVAWQYFKVKAYQAVLMRTDETLAAHPTFSKIDEILYLTGMSSYYLSVGKGKQKLNSIKLTPAEKERFEPKRLKEDAIAFLGMLVEEYPKSKYRKKAKKALKKIKPSN